MSVKRTVILMALTAATAMLGTSPVPAWAWTPPTDEPLMTPEVIAALGQARAIWGAAPACPSGVTVYVYDEPDPTIAGWGDQPGCRIWLSRQFMATLPPVGSEYRPQSLCRAVAHEYGHNLGYGHDYPGHDGVMMGVGAPFECLTPPDPPAPVAVASVAQPRSRGRTHRVGHASRRGCGRPRTTTAPHPRRVRGCR